MEILSYLAELIQSSKEVSIPGLGTIYKKKSPGRYDTGSHSFLPPDYQLSFKTETAEHLLLADFISKKRNISVESAAYYIDQFSAEARQQLADHHEADLGQIGKLALINDEIVLEPNPGFSFSFDFFGFPQIKDEALSLEEPVHSETEPDQEQEEVTALPQEVEPDQEQEEATALPQEVEPDQEQEEATALPQEAEPDHEDHELETITDENQLSEENPGDSPVEPVYRTEDLDAADLNDNQEVYDEISEVNFPAEQQQVAEPIENAAEAAAPVTDDAIQYVIQEDEPKSETPVYLKVLFGILIILIGLLIVYLVNPDVLNNLNKNSGIEAKADSAAKLNGQADLKRTADSVAYQDSLKRSSLTAPADSAKDSTSTIQPLDTAKTITYEIIGSSVYKQKEADDFISNMKRRGINAKIVSRVKGKKIKISIATFKEEKTARTERNRLEKELKIPGLYIYTNKPK